MDYLAGFIIGMLVMLLWKKNPVTIKIINESIAPIIPAMPDYVDLNKVNGQEDDHFKELNKTVENVYATALRDFLGGDANDEAN